MRSAFWHAGACVTLLGRAAGRDVAALGAARSVRIERGLQPHRRSHPGWRAVGEVGRTIGVHRPATQLVPITGGSPLKARAQASQCSTEVSVSVHSPPLMAVDARKLHTPEVRRPPRPDRSA